MRCLAVEVALGEVLVVAGSVLGLNDRGADPRRRFARVLFSRADEFCIPPTVWPFGESLDTNAQQIAANANNQSLELVLIHVFVSVLHGNATDSWLFFFIAEPL